MSNPSPISDADGKSGNKEPVNKPDANTSPQPTRRQDLRRMVALSIMHQIGQCRLALKYAVVGWTGTLEKDKIPAALANTHSVTMLNSRMAGLERALASFQPRDPEGQALDADNVRRVEYVRLKLLEISPGVKSTRFVLPVLDEIEGDARRARLLPPQDQAGWAWSWRHDDWFRWDAGEKKWVAAAEAGLRLDHLV